MRTRIRVTGEFLVGVFVCLALLGIIDLVLSKNSKRSPHVAVLQVYPRVFKFNNGEAALYYKQMGKDTVNVYFNGTEISPSCFKVRYIYSGTRRIDGFWVKCLLPSQFGTFIVKTPLGVDRYRNFDMYEL